MFTSSTQPQTRTPGSDPYSLLTPLVDALRARFGDAIGGILLYGSCLRSGDFHDGLVDIYVVVDNYRVYGHWLLGAANRVLAPNVFYVECGQGEQTIRCKYAVISSRDLVRATSRHCFESYFWGRLAQPVALLYSRDGDDEVFLHRVLDSARTTFLMRSLPLLPAQGTVAELWQQALARSYGTELRVEGPDRARQLVEANEAFFCDIAATFSRENPDQLRLFQHDDGLHYQTTLPSGRRKLASVSWSMRSWWGKLLSLCRLTKGLFTFDGGLDYIAWKLQRHSGQTIEIPEKVRRRPLIHIWGLAWQLYKRGIFK